MKASNFVSIDFEHLTLNLRSTCATGRCKVINRVISLKFYSLISPIPDDNKINNSIIDG